MGMPLIKGGQGRSASEVESVGRIVLVLAVVFGLLLVLEIVAWVFVRMSD